MKVWFKKDKTPNWIQRLIGWRTYSPFSHVEIEVNGKCYSSVLPAGVRGEQKEKVITNPWDWEAVDISDLTWDPGLSLDPSVVEEWYEQHRGAPYDTRSLLEIMAGKPSSDEKAFNCAESVLSALQHAGILGWYDASRATPEGLYLALRGLVEGRGA